MPRLMRLTVVAFVLAGAVSPAQAASQADRPNDQTPTVERTFPAFKPLSRPTVPMATSVHGPPRTPIDAFVLRALSRKGLDLSPQAQRAQLIRRASFDVVGLPPSPTETAAFLGDIRPGAYVRLVDRLLASPHFGERWGRHWLDVVGYTDLVSYDGDTTGIFGFIKGRWRYRDYVIDAFNDDRPYDSFLTEQMAGDELVDWRNARRFTPRTVQLLAATGFWRNAEDRSESAKELEYKWSFLHNTMQTFGTGVLGLTLRCARCHDHRHEPIPQRDYYRLLALITPAFNIDTWKNPKERAIPSISAAEKTQLDAENAAINKKIASLEASIATVKSQRRASVIEARLAEIPEPIRADTRVAMALATDKRSPVQQYLFSKFGAHLTLTDKQLQTVLTPGDRTAIEGHSTEIATLNSQLRTHGWIQAVYDVGAPPKTRLLDRGDFKTPGEEVEPGFLSILTGNSTRFRDLVRRLPHSSGRRTALARWLTQSNSPASGLVARVVVNRIWQHLTGMGIVATSENLGHSGAPPTHPDLLEWLASELVENGWRIKPLIRTILLSSTYRQASRRTGQTTRLPHPETVDPDNRLLWKARLRRLESEIIRDAMLSASNRFNTTMRGTPVPLTYRRDGVASFDTKKLASPAAPWRRSIYLFQRRVYHLTMQGVFDQPTVAGSVCHRSSSAVVLQSLSMFNDALALEQAEAFSERLWSEAGQSQRLQVVHAFRIALSREPSQSELKLCVDLLSRHTRRYERGGSSRPAAARQAVVHLCRVLFNSSEFLYVE